MGGFMNDELRRIRDSLECGHCGATFKGSDSQARKVKYEGCSVYCSVLCRHAALRNKLSKPVPNRGPCKTCGKEFYSRQSKYFCSVDCYLSSEQFKEQLKRNREAMERNSPEHKCSTECLECGEKFSFRKSAKRKFCSTVCYRAHMSKRFDRWIANPEQIALPQCYDEFLDREELPCIVDGCGWRGTSLSHHVNFAHGIKSNEFKRAAGFNVSTGVVSKPLAVKLRERAPVGVAVNGNPPSRKTGSDRDVKKYVSREAKEHMKKSKALAGSGPDRECLGCGHTFKQKTPFGRALYCSVSCSWRALR